jgi:hypothetical protein
MDQTIHRTTQPIKRTHRTTQSTEIIYRTTQSTHKIRRTTQFTNRFTLFKTACPIKPRRFRNFKFYFTFILTSQIGYFSP